MLLKTLAHSWATSKLEQEEGRTQSLIQKLDRERDAAHERIQARKESCSRQIESYQKNRENELKAHIALMNELLSITRDYLPELNQFQDLLLTCVGSWMNRDLAHKEIEMVYEKIKSFDSTIKLLDAYIIELSLLSQRERRLAWREFCKLRELTFTNDFVVNEKTRVENRPITGNKEFETEIKRLRSHHRRLIKQKNEQYAVRDKLQDGKNSAVKIHAANKEIMREKFRLCKEDWDKVAEKLALCVYRDTNNRHVIRWAHGAIEGSTLSQVRSKIIKFSKQLVLSVFSHTEHKHIIKWARRVTRGSTLSQVKKKTIEAADREFSRAQKKTDCAYRIAKSIDKKFENCSDDHDRYILRVKEAHDRNKFDTFDDDKKMRDNLRNKKRKISIEKKNAWTTFREKKNQQVEIKEARSMLYGLGDDLRKKVRQILPLHPDAAVDALHEVLGAESMKYIGIGTKEQRRVHWENKRNETENATYD